MLLNLKRKALLSLPAELVTADVIAQICSGCPVMNQNHEERLKSMVVYKPARCPFAVPAAGQLHGLSEEAPL